MLTPAEREWMHRNDRASDYGLPESIPAELRLAAATFVRNLRLIFANVPASERPWAAAIAHASILAYQQGHHAGMKDVTRAIEAVASVRDT